MNILIQTFFGALTSASVLLISIAFILKKGRIGSLLKSNLLNQEALLKLMEQMAWEKELEPLIDRKLEDLTTSLRQKNAMINMFMTPAIVDPLKEEGKAKLLEMMPAVEEKLAEYLSKDRVAEKLEIQVKKWILQKMPLLLGAASFLGATVGFFVGIVLTLA